MDLPLSTDIPARRQHPAIILLDAVRGLSALVLPLIIFVVSGGGEQRFILVAGAAWVVISVAYQIYAWWQFTYEVTGSELRVNSGVLERKERLIPLERVQAVDINETPLQRLFQVVGIRVETAAGGGEGADVKIGALTRADAEQLRRRLSVIRRAAVAAPATGAVAPEETAAAPVDAAEGELIRRLSTRELLVAGVTSGTIGPALAVVGFFSQIIDDVLPDEVWSRLALDATMLSPRALVPLIVAVAIFAWLLAIAGTVLTYGGFELRRSGDRVMISHGLLERRRRTVPVARMQAIVVREGLLRRPLGLATVSFESAGYGQESGESGVLWPLLRRDEAMALVAEAAPGMATSIAPDELAGPPPRAFSRYLVADVVGWLAICAGAMLAGWILDRSLLSGVGWFQWWFGALLLIATPLVVVDSVMRFRDAGWRIDPTQLLVISSGGLVRRTTVVPRRRIQFRTVTSNPFQRRAELASLKVAIASGGEGGGAFVNHLDAGVAFAVAGRLTPPARRYSEPEYSGDWTADRTIEPA